MIYDVSHKIFWGSGSVNIKLSKNRRENHQAWTFQPSLKHGKGWSCWDRRKGPCSDLTTGMGPGGNGLCFKHVQQKCDWRNWLFWQTGGSSLREVPIFGQFLGGTKIALDQQLLRRSFQAPRLRIVSRVLWENLRRMCAWGWHGFLTICIHMMMRTHSIFDYVLTLSLSIYIWLLCIYIY